MSLFRPDYTRNGPGIDKNAPKKTGIALFFEIIAREFWQICKLNVLFLVSALPLVTFGAARAALSRCTINMVRDVPNNVWTDFGQEFKNNFIRSTMCGLAELFVIGVLLILIRSTAVNENSLLQGVILSAIFAVRLFWGYFWPMLVTIDVPFAAAVKNSAALPVLCLKHSVPAVLCGTILHMISLWFFPLSLPFIVFFTFGFSSFIISFAAWFDMQRLVLRRNENKGELE